MRRWRSMTAGGMLVPSSIPLVIILGLLGGCARPHPPAAADAAATPAPPPPSSDAPPPMTKIESLSGPHFAFNQATLTPLWTRICFTASARRSDRRWLRASSPDESV